MTKPHLIRLALILVFIAALPVRPAAAQTTPTYVGPQITELLPNPASPLLDSEAEYVELHNPTELPLDLSVYTLHTGSLSSTHEFALTGITLQPGEYRAFYSLQTGLNLVNAGTGQAWLVGPGFVRVSETPWYPADMGEDKAWALIDGSWQVTATLSPGAANHVPAPPAPPEAPVQPPAEISTLEPCPEGKFRNPETNRCKAVEQPAAPPACGPGQERNPATNRCRRIAAAPAPQTCDPGEERNPATNRCRQVVTATIPSACQPGYERNPETNRCRKLAAVKAATTDRPSPTGKPGLNSGLIAGVSGLIVAYGLYEYRRDLALAFNRLRSNLRRPKR